MKNTLIAIFSIFNIAIFGQNTMNDQLSKLFLNLNITASFNNIATNTHLKFDYGINRGIPLIDEQGKIVSNDKHSFIAKFDKNPLIDSRIKEGQISIMQQSEEIQSGHFTINETVHFYTEEDLIDEYYKLIALFEEFGYRVKNSTILNENQEIKYENTEILMKTESGKSTLHISYHFPEGWQEKNEYFLVFVYTNH
jgi:hypothetical protein